MFQQNRFPERAMPVCLSRQFCWLRKDSFFVVALMFPRELIELSLSHFWWRYIFVSIACMCFLPDVALGPMKPVSVEAMETRHWASTFSFHDLGRGRSGIIDTTQSGSFGDIFSVPDWASPHHWEAFHRLERPDQLHL